MKKFNKELICAYIFGVFAILTGLVILIFGEIGRGIGDTIYQFKGFERLYGFYPIVIGAFIVWVFRVKHSKDKDHN
jgi:hypothetical protein